MQMTRLIGLCKQFSPPDRNFGTSGATEPSIIRICWGIGKKTIEMKGKGERRRGACTGGWAHIPTTVSSGPEVVGSRLHLLCTAHYALCTVHCALCTMQYSALRHAPFRAERLIYWKSKSITDEWTDKVLETLAYLKRKIFCILVFQT